LRRDPDEVHVRALLDAHPAGRELARAPFAPVHGGGLNRGWRIDIGTRSWFVRLASAVAALLGADWDSEAKLLSIAGVHGLAPQLVLALPSEGLLVTEFLAGAVIGRDDASKDERLVQVGRLLGALHRLQAGCGIRRLDFAEQARRLQEQLAPGVHPARVLAERAHAVFARLHPSVDRVAMCHNDVHHANLIDHDGRLRLVDWEYGGIGDPVYDVAGFLAHHALDERRTRVLLAAYGAGIRPERLRDACWAYDYVQWLWYLLAAQRATQPVAGAGFAERAQKLAVRLVRTD
jgi:thiamine kinase-like enzyme